MREQAGRSLPGAGALPSGEGRGRRPGRRAAVLVPAAVFLALALVAAVIGYVVFQRQAREVRQRAGQEITAVRVLKTTELAGWQADQRGDAVTLADDPILSDSLERWLDEGQPLPAPVVVRSLVSTYQQMHEYARFTVLDPSLHSVYSSPAGLPRLGRYTRSLAREAMAENEVMFSDFFVDGRGNIALEYVAPIRDSSPSPDAVLGAYVLRIDPEAWRLSRARVVADAGRERSHAPGGAARRRGRLHQPDARTGRRRARRAPAARLGAARRRACGSRR